jgi:hypothetical protein
LHASIAAMSLVGLVYVLPSGPAAAQVPPGDLSGGVVVSVDTRHPHGAVNEGLLGTNQPVPIPTDIAEVAQLGVDWARTDMSLDATYNCSHGTWDPAALDRRVAEDRAMGGTPELIVDYSPSCMTALGQSLEPPSAGGYGPWRALVETAAYHEISAEGVRVFEVWNEPDGTFWYGSVADYLTMYRVTASAIEAAAARAHVQDVLVGGPALLYSDPAWLVPFLAFVDAAHVPLGFVSWHYYGNYPALGPFPEGPTTVPPAVPGAPPYWYNPLTRAQSYGEQVQLVRALVAAHPRLHPLTVVDEWNLDAGYDPRADTVYDSAFAAAVLDSVQGAGLDRMAFFRIADDVPGTFGNWGMLFADGTEKPVYTTFRFWHDLAGQILPESLVPDQSLADVAGRVGAVASIGADGAVKVLLYDYAPYDPSGGYGTGEPNPYGHHVTLELRGLAPAARLYGVQLLDGGGLHSSSGTTVGAISLVLPGESVALVEIAGPSAAKEHAVSFGGRR